LGSKVVLTIVGSKGHSAVAITNELVVYLCLLQVETFRASQIPLQLGNSFVKCG
jgi:hypothetical protein